MRRFHLGFPGISVIITRVEHSRSLNARSATAGRNDERENERFPVERKADVGRAVAKEREKRKRGGIERRTKQEFRLKFRNVRGRTDRRGMNECSRCICAPSYTTEPSASALRNVIRPTT